MTLNAFETLQLRDVGFNDLTGTRVVASLPVAVFSGNYFTGIPEDTSRPADHVSEQLPPITTWGTKFALAPTPDVIREEQYIFVAAEDDTEILLHTLTTTEEVSPSDA